MLIDCHVVCCGPGPEAIGQWSAGVAGEPRIVILAGLAGSLSRRFTARSAYIPAAVVGPDGKRHRPTLIAPGSDDAPAPVVTSVPATVTSLAAKRALAQDTGTDLVDRESAAFAHAAIKRKWRWTIVRGISDGPDTALPRDIDAWVDQRGRTRIGMVLKSLARRPGILPSLVTLWADSTAAMVAAARLIEKVIGDR